MTTVYTVSDHPLLGAKAKKLGEDELAEQVALAAEWLGISETAYTGSALTKIKRALVLQLNYQLLLPLEAFFKKQESSAASRMNVTYRDGISLTLPVAVSLVREVNGSTGWLDCTSMRRAVR